jgi:RNA polymerase sigma factor (sigma-70 family)
MSAVALRSPVTVWAVPAPDRFPRPARQRFSKGDPSAVEVAELVHAAAEGDQTAWNALVDRFSGLLWATTRAHRLTPSDSAEVVQTTWLRLVEHLDRIRDPERLGAWLATTARHECLRLIRQGAREFAASYVVDLDGRSETPVGGAILSAERDNALWKAFSALGERCQTLLRLLIADTSPSYEEVSAALGMPVGAIGPTRQRCLERLRRDPHVSDLSLDTGEAQ